MAGTSASSTGVNARAAAPAPSSWRRTRLSGSAGRAAAGAAAPCRWRRRRAGRARAGGRGEDGQGGGQGPGTAASFRRIVGVHLDQPGDLRVRIAHQREGQDLAPDSRRGQQQVVVAGQVRSLVRQDGDQLGIQRLHVAVVRITVGCGPPTQ